MLEKFIAELSRLNLRSSEVIPEGKNYTVLKISANTDDEEAESKLLMLKKRYGAKIGAVTEMGIIPLSYFTLKPKQLMNGRSGQFWAPAQLSYVLTKNIKTVKWAEIG